MRPGGEVFLRLGLHPALSREGASGYLAGRVPVCTVIGFPNGYMTTAAKALRPRTP